MVLLQKHSLYSVKNQMHACMLYSSWNPHKCVRKPSVTKTCNICREDLRNPKNPQIRTWIEDFLSIRWFWSFWQLGDQTWLKEAISSKNYALKFLYLRKDSTRLFFVLEIFLSFKKNSTRQHCWNWYKVRTPCDRTETCVLWAGPRLPRPLWLGKSVG